MKYGNLSKYIKETGVKRNALNDAVLYGIRLPTYTRELEEMIALEAIDVKALLDKFIAFITKMFNAGLDYANNVINRLGRKVQEVIDSLKRALDIPVEVTVSGLLTNTVVVGDAISFSKYKDTVTYYNNLRNRVKSALNKSFKLSTDIARGITVLDEVITELKDIIEEQTERTSTYLDSEGSSVTIDNQGREQLLKILQNVSDTAEAHPMTGISVSMLTEDLKKYFDNGRNDADEINEYLPAIQSKQKELAEKINNFNNGRLKFLDQIVADIRKVASAVNGSVSTEDVEVEGVDYSSAHVNEDTAPLGIDDSPDNALFKQLRTISTEALVIGNFARYFSRKADSLSIAVQEGFKYLTTYNYDPMETLHPLQMANYTETLDFMDHEDLKVPQPTSFKGELLPYTALLMERAQTMNKVLTNVIQPATTRFGHYLSLPMDRAERRDFEFGINIQDDRDKMNKEDAALFGSNRSSSASLGNLFNSFSDFVDAERNMLVTKSTLGEGGMDAVKKAVQALTITASALIKRLGQDSQNRPSNEFVKMISDQLTEVARWVEWYSAQMTRIIETNNALYEVEKEILKL